MKTNLLRERLISELAIPEKYLNRLILRSPHTYKIYTVSKRSGGLRTIAQPAKETKYLQYWIMSEIFTLLPVHDSAKAYKSGASIKANASVHAKHSYISKFDFKDFFTSIKEEHLRSHLHKYLDNLSNEDIDDIIRICCIRLRSKEPLCLSIGAPSSPLLSNSILYDFDISISEWCSINGVNYSRYADDLTFSTNEKRKASDIESAVRTCINSLDYPKLRLNRKKTTHLSKKHQRRVTGIIINNQGELSLGRKKKRIISSLIHKYSINTLSHDDIFMLQGLLSFANDIEPAFVYRLKNKYGNNTIKEIFSIRKNEQN
jgi:RNA-directed DNA polymerase